MVVAATPIPVWIVGTDPLEGAAVEAVAEDGAREPLVADKQVVRRRRPVVPRDVAAAVDGHKEEVSRLSIEGPVP